MLLLLFRPDRFRIESSSISLLLNMGETSELCPGAAVESPLLFSNDHTGFRPPMIEALVMNESMLLRLLLLLLLPVLVGSLTPLDVDEEEEVEEGDEVVCWSRFRGVSRGLAEVEAAGLVWLNSEEKVSF